MGVVEMRRVKQLEDENRRLEDLWQSGLARHKSAQKTWR